MLTYITFLLYVIFSILEAKSVRISCPDSPDSAKIVNAGRKVKNNMFLLAELYHDCNIISVESYYICTW